MDITVIDVPERSRYEATSGDDLVGLLDYRRQGDTIVYTHAETDPVHRGKGIAGQVVQRALVDARALGLRVVPQCPYVRDWITLHPEHQDLLA